MVGCGGGGGDGNVGDGGGGGDCTPALCGQQFPLAEPNKMRVCHRPGSTGLSCPDSVHSLLGYTNLGLHFRLV
ncbi:hypothetical protein PoB_002342900 [Plakobranchus ocellatus]|uniref:Uncharacterized protein n=1 Tax=Plakobranchus ocellatus TaxID=259542 RepID=A0AAV3ZSQ9_9GAST|nr:hypothetical protein PoB_002342900 [Plakobranchus ocellatus]